MKKTPANRRVNTNPAFSIPDNSKLSPKNASFTPNAYFLRTPRAIQPTVGRSDATNKTHSPRHMPSASASCTANNVSSNIGFLSVSAAANQQNQHLKTPCSFQSPVQKSPSYYLLKGKNSETNLDLNGTSGQARKNCSPLSSESSGFLNRKNSNSEYYPISLSIHFNGDKRQSVTPNTKHTNHSVQYYPSANVVPFGSSETATKGSHEYEKEKLKFSKGFQENMKPDSEPYSSNTRRQHPESKNMNNHPRTENNQKRVVLSEIDMNSLENINKDGRTRKYNSNDPSDSKKIHMVPLNIQIDDYRVESYKPGEISERLLYKSQESDKEQPLSQRIVGNCVKHGEKRGKYYLPHESDPEKIDYYCSKCAVDLALKGVKVLNIDGHVDSLSSNQHSLEFERGNGNPKATTNQIPTENTTEEEALRSEQHQIDLLMDSIKLKRRNEELTNFIGRLDALLQKMKSLENCVDHERKKVINNFRNEKENIELFCKQLVSKISEHTENICRSLDIEQSEAIQQYDLLAKTPLRYLSEISQIKGDIEENLQNIMKNIEDKPYKRIMHKYEERLGYYENFVREKEITLTQKLAPPRCHSTLEELKKLLKESISTLLGDSTLIQEKSALINLGDFEGFMRCDEEISELPLQNGLGRNSVNSQLQQQIPSKTMTQNYTLISFENKDLFQNALTTSKSGDQRSDSMIYETVHEHEEECPEGVGENNEIPELSPSDPNYVVDNKEDTGLTYSRKNSITRNSRYDDNLKKDNFEVLAVPLNNGKQLNEESSSPKGNFQKSLFTSPNFKGLN